MIAVTTLDPSPRRRGPALAAVVVAGVILLLAATLAQRAPAKFASAGDADGARAGTARATRTDTRDATTRQIGRPDPEASKAPKASAGRVERGARGARSSPRAGVAAATTGDGRARRPDPRCAVEACEPAQIVPFDVKSESRVPVAPLGGWLHLESSLRTRTAGAATEDRPTLAAGLFTRDRRPRLPPGVVCDDTGLLLVDAFGEPVEDVWISIGSRVTHEYLHFRSDADGRIRLPANVPDDATDLQALQDGYARQRVRIEPRLLPGSVLVMEAERAISGVVLRADDASPVEISIVVLVFDSDLEPHMALADWHGRFEFHGLPSGDAQVYVAERNRPDWICRYWKVPAPVALPGDELVIVLPARDAALPVAPR